jgi:hypothetical protein
MALKIMPHGRLQEWVADENVEKYLGGLRRAQVEIDPHPERYKHYHLRAVPER